MTLVKFKNSHNLNPYSGINRQLGFPSLFNEVLDRFWQEDGAWIPSVNIKERADDFKIDLAIPGMDKKDFQIEVEKDILTISGERKEDISEENEKITRREFHYGSFKRSFNLPESANAESIQANYKDGILSITLAKKAEVKTKKQITIE